MEPSDNVSRDRETGTSLLGNPHSCVLARHFWVANHSFRIVRKELTDQADPCSLWVSRIGHVWTAEPHRQCAVGAFQDNLLQ
jgi:hypothetical protein